MSVPRTLCCYPQSRSKGRAATRIASASADYGIAEQRPDTVILIPCPSPFSSCPHAHIIPVFVEPSDAPTWRPPPRLRCRSSFALLVIFPHTTEDPSSPIAANLLTGADSGLPFLWSPPPSLFTINNAQFVQLIYSSVSLTTNLPTDLKKIGSIQRQYLCTAPPQSFDRIPERQILVPQSLCSPFSSRINRALQRLHFSPL
jgi:hypothetical protein